MICIQSSKTYRGDAKFKCSIPYLPLSYVDGRRAQKANQPHIRSVIQGHDLQAWSTTHTHSTFGGQQVNTKIQSVPSSRRHATKMHYPWHGSVCSLRGDLFRLALGIEVRSICCGDVVTVDPSQSLSLSTRLACAGFLACPRPQRRKRKG